VDLIPFVLSAFSGVAAALAVALVSFLAYRRIEFGLALIGLAMTLDLALRESFGLKLGINLYPEDLVYGLLFAIGGLRFLQARGPGVSLLWLGFGAILFLSFALGTGKNGTAAGVQFRGYFYGWSAAFYAMTFLVDLRTLRNLLSGVLWLAVVAQVGACLRWLTLVTGFQVLAPNPGGSEDMDLLRSINAAEALMLANAVIVSFGAGELGGAVRQLRHLCWIWIPSIAVLQHRSVWMAALGGIGVLFSLRTGEQRRIGPAQVAAGAAIAAVLILLALGSGRGLDRVANSVGESARRGIMMEDTATWRLNSWEQLLEKWGAGGPVVYAIGFPFGSDMTRYSKQGQAVVRVGVAAHNAYIQTLYNGGVIGLGLFLAFLARLATQLIRLRSQAEFRDTAGLLLALLACQLLFYLPYGVVPVENFLLGVSFAFVRLAARETVAADGRSAEYSPAR
jgi:hypothetical protein